jgi:cobalt-zinc-cadmium efflux system outer membrane protein
LNLITRTRSVRHGGIVITMLAVLAGCQTYRRAPLDLASHETSWSLRSTDSEAVRALAARLAESQPASAGPFEPGDGLSLPEGEAVALFYNADLRRARVRAAGAAAVARKAGRWEDPVFGFDGERILAGVSDPWVLAASLGVTLPFSGRLDAEKREACAEARASVAHVVAAEWAVRMRLRSLWLQWSFQRLRAELARASAARLDDVGAIAARLEQAGELSRIEARLFRTERTTRTVELRLLDARTAELELEIRNVMGLKPDAPLRLVPALGAGSPAGCPPGDSNPELAALRADYEVAEEGLRLEIRKQYPDVTIAPGVKEEDGDPRVLLGLKLPIPVWNRNARGIAEATAKRELARADYEAAFEALVATRAAAELQLATANAQRLEIEAALIPLVDEQSGDVKRVTDLGQVDTLLLLDTLVRDHEAKARLIDARLAESLASVRLQGIEGPRRQHMEGCP